MPKALAAVKKEYVIAIGGGAQDRWYAGESDEDDGEASAAPISVREVEEALHFESFQAARDELRRLVKRWTSHSFRLDVAEPISDSQ